MNEQKLIENLRKGKSGAYQYLFTRYYNVLCNYIGNLCNDPSLAEDIVQESLVAFWEKRKRIVITTSLKNYLFRTCHNQFLQHIRKNKIQYDTLEKIRWDMITDTFLEDDLYENRLQKLNALIDQLPPKCKEIFIKSKFERKKYKEIAADLGISIKTVENQMSKALSFLKANATLFML